MKNNKHRTRAFILIAVAISGVLLMGPSETYDVTLSSMLDQMVNLEWLARKAPEGARGIQFSSYDRASRIENGEKVDWFANVDIGEYIRKEKTSRGEEFVMAEADGPGAITRFWSANAGRRIWRVYLDGEDEPVIEVQGKKLLGGKVGPWDAAYAGKRSMGYNFIFPIPFQKGVKVTAAKPANMGTKMMYYHVNVVLFPEGTKVETFTMDQLSREATKIRKVGDAIKNPGLDLPRDASRLRLFQTIKPGTKDMQIGEIEGPGAIRMIEIKVKGEKEAALREILGRTLLTAQWDDEPGPSITCPLGDFFGSSPGVNPMNSMPLMIESTPEGVTLVSRWAMPFKKKASLKLSNYSDYAAEIKSVIAYTDWEFGEDSLYFNAAWREKNNIATRPISDWTVLQAKGAGRFVGLQQNVRNPLEHFWWGEGDEKVFVDGEEFPSTFGTGTEDYFGYAWCTQYIPFIHAYHGISLPTDTWLIIPQGTAYLPWKALSEATNKADLVSQYRFQILDNIPFETGIQFDMEVQHHRDGFVDMNAVSYWYADAGETDDRPELNLKDREVW